jgi:NADPH:quinone reductase-like Zn-dependent oxidoreductase
LSIGVLPGVGRLPSVGLRGTSPRLALIVALVCASPIVGFSLSALPALAQTPTIRQYQLQPQGGALRLVMVEVPRPTAGPGEVLVRVRATSLNRRDLSILQGGYGPGSNRDGLVPLSDGAGEVVGIGPGVTRFRVGDRVAGTFFARWVDGRRTATANASARGGSIDGMLSEMIVSPEDGLVHIPEHLSFEEAATLPCAGVTAWNGLFTYGGLQPGDFVLLEGTGGVSVFGLQLAAAAGARPIITSSSDAKLARARDLGAFGTVNYRTNAEWQDDVRALTGAGGVQHVLEVGGQDTLERALRALGYGGHIAMIGSLSGAAPSMPTGSFVGRGVRVSGVYVGSRGDFEAMNAFIAEHRLRPVVDRVFPFEEAEAAYALMESEQHLGKIVITL